MDSETVRRLVLEALGEVAPDADVTHLSPHASFHDQFELDSVDYINFVLAVERRLSIRVDAADYPRLSTLSGCLTYLLPRLVTDPSQSSN